MSIFKKRKKTEKKTEMNLDDLELDKLIEVENLCKDRVGKILKVDLEKAKTSKAIKKLDEELQDIDSKRKKVYARIFKKETQIRKKLSKKQRKREADELLKKTGVKS